MASPATLRGSPSEGGLRRSIGLALEVDGDKEPGSRSVPPTMVYSGSHPYPLEGEGMSKPRTMQTKAAAEWLSRGIGLG